MNTDDKQKQPNRIHIEGSNDSKLPDVEPGKDGPGVVRPNQNPRANENINTPNAEKQRTGSSTENLKSEVGTEVTDGEDG